MTKTTRNTFVGIVLIVALAAAFIYSQPVGAHHVRVAEANTDREAHIAYAVEWLGQTRAVMFQLNLYRAAPSNGEKRDAALNVERTLEASIEHMRGLRVEPCFARFATLVHRELNAAADAWTNFRRTGEFDFSEADRWRQATRESVSHPSTCSEVVVTA